MRILAEYRGDAASLIEQHTARPVALPADRAFVRLNMVSSADGATAVGGVSGALGDETDRRVFAALRERADAVLVGLSTVVTERYHPPARADLDLLVVAPRPEVTGNPDLFASGRATFVLGTDAPPSPEGVPEIRVGAGPRADLAELADRLAGRVILLEGGPRLAGAMLALGLVNEFFHTVAPLLVGGESARLAHGDPADPVPWALVHGFCDAEGYLFLRYARG